MYDGEEEEGERRPSDEPQETTLWAEMTSYISAATHHTANTTHKNNSSIISRVSSIL